MRVSSSSFPNQFLEQVRTISSRQSRLQAQAASGQRIQSGEEDPAAMQRIRRLETERSTNVQFLKSLTSVSEKATATYGAMRGLKTISDRVTELAILAEGTRSPDELKIYGAEVGQLIEQAATVANSRHEGEFIFAGTRSDKPPFEVLRDENGRVTSVSYLGNTESQLNEIADGFFLSGSVPGANFTGVGEPGLVGDNRSGADLFGHMVNLQKHLVEGDTTSIGAIDRIALAKDEEHFVLQIGRNAAIQTRLESARSVAMGRGSIIDNQISTEGSADLAETLVQLNKTQTAYQAALQSGASVMQLSLLNYLR